MGRSAMARLAAVGLILAGAACAPSGGTVERDIQPVVLGLMERVRPEGGSVFAFSGLRRDASGVHASWEVETGMNWAAYSAWVAERVPRDFRRDPADRSSMLFRRSMEADFYVFRLEPLSSLPPFRVRATFDGYPN